MKSNDNRDSREQEYRDGHITHAYTQRALPCFVAVARLFCSSRVNVYKRRCRSGDEVSRSSAMRTLMLTCAKSVA